MRIFTVLQNTYQAALCLPQPFYNISGIHRFSDAEKNYTLFYADYLLLRQTIKDQAALTRSFLQPLAIKYRCALPVHHKTIGQPMMNSEYLSSRWH